jgi:Calcium-dependent channel, 7TM region, putative phosphate
MSILPYILRWIIRPRGFWMRNEFVNAVVSAHWLFLFLNVFVIVSLAGSLFSVINQAKQHFVFSNLDFFFWVDGYLGVSNFRV